jgi:long-chain acyl-CoA synthetase
MTETATDTPYGDPAFVEANERGTVLAYWAERQPDVPAVLSADGDRTWSELNARVNQLVRALRRRGLQQGDAVALMCRNLPQFVEVVGATQRAGWRLTTVNFHLTGDEAGYIVDDSEAKAFIADASFPAAATRAVELAPGATARLAIGGPIDGFDDFEAAVSAENADNVEDTAPGATMLYTSGTTGRPKGVHRDAAPARANALVAAGSGYRPGVDVHLVTGPLYHAAPLLISLNVPLLCGAAVVLMDGWDAEETLRLIERHGVTRTHMVATMFHRLLSLPDEVRDRYDLSSLTYVVGGAAPGPGWGEQRLVGGGGPLGHE